MRLVPYLRGDFANREPRVFPEISRIFNDFFHDWPMNSLLQDRGNWMPPVDILEKDGNMVLRCELPGMTEADIDVKLEGNLLTLKGEKRFESEGERDNYHRVERFTGTFSRSFTLPDSVIVEKIKADYRNGVLIVTIPQKSEVRPWEIPVNVQ
jgi:HSP20 family protein